MKKVIFVLMFSFMLCSFSIADDTFDDNIGTSDLNDESSQIDRQMDNSINSQQQDRGFEEDAPANESGEKLEQDIQTDVIDDAIV